MSDFVEVSMPRGAGIAVADGEHVIVFTDRWAADEGTSLRPIQRAVIVARLRALADELERAES